jgi:hypothetical protein
MIPSSCTVLTECRVLQEAVKVMAKSLIRNRHAVTKLHGLKSQLQAVSLRIQVRWRSSTGHPGCPQLSGLSGQEVGGRNRTGGWGLAVVMRAKA